MLVVFSLVEIDDYWRQPDEQTDTDTDRPTEERVDPEPTTPPVFDILDKEEDYWDATCKCHST